MNTDYVKEKIDKTQHIRISRLCGDKVETINHIISECNKLALWEYKTRHDLVMKESHRELSRKLDLTVRKGCLPQLRIRPGERDAQISLGFWDTNASPNLG